MLFDTTFLVLAHSVGNHRIHLLGGFANFIIAGCYFTISTLIALGLWRNRQAGIDLFAAVTGGIFFSCAAGHTFHAIGFLGLEGIGFWQTGADFLTIVPAIAFLSLHRHYSLLIGSTQVLESQKELTQRNAELERKVAERTQELEVKNKSLQEALSELHKMQTHLVQTEKMSMLGQMVSGISHEINNPINFIYGNLPHIEEHMEDLLKVLSAYRSNCPSHATGICEVLEEVELDYVLEDLPRIIESMKTGAERIRELVINLRNFYRLDEAEMKPANLNAGIESTLLLLNTRFKRKIEIFRQYGDIPPVECHINQLNQVFMNLLSNAIDALLEKEEKDEDRNIKKQIVISVHCKDNWVIVSISDNGNGISADVKEHLFKPFFTTKAIGIGTGLGLSICYQIVTENHQGKIYCQSILGKGTTFTIELPINQKRNREIKGTTETRQFASSVVNL